MKRYFKNYLICILFVSCLFPACEKAQDSPLPIVDTAFEFGIVGQLYPAIKNQYQQSLQIIIPQDSNKSRLRSFFKSPVNTTVLLNSSMLLTGETIADYSSAVKISLLTQGFEQQNWIVNVQRESEAYGLGSNVKESKSLNRNYDFYRDQNGSGKFAVENCGPAVAAMAVHWADSGLNASVSAARNLIKPNGGDWSTSDMVDYLNGANIKHTTIYLSNLSQQIKKCIDRNYVVILCLDMYQVAYNANPIQRTNKFYLTSHAGWSHFLLVKGYRIVDGTFFLEVYDPNSKGTLHELTGQPKGKDRYYAADQIERATDAWWKYAIVLAPKGEPIAGL